MFLFCLLFYFAISRDVLASLSSLGDKNQIGGMHFVCFCLDSLNKDYLRANFEISWLKINK